MGLLVIHAGVSTTVQDLGRTGYREWGIPPGGAFDRGSAALANALLGNSLDCALLELTLVGGVYESRIPLALALAGAPMPAAIERAGTVLRSLDVPQSFAMAPGDRLVLGGPSVGARTYLAVRGGWKTPSHLGSRSREDRLTAGALLDAESGAAPSRRPCESSWEDPSRAPFRIIDGPDAGLAIGFEAWASARFRVGRQGNRMGLRLEGPALTVDSPPERTSAPIAPGAVQVTGGQAIVLGVACGTMGGYPHVAHLITADLDRLGQIRPGDTIALRRVTLDEAREIDRSERKRRSCRVRTIGELASDGLVDSSGPR